MGSITSIFPVQGFRGSVYNKGDNFRGPLRLQLPRPSTKKLLISG